MDFLPTGTFEVADPEALQMPGQSAAPRFADVPGYEPAKVDAGGSLLVRDREAIDVPDLNTWTTADAGAFLGARVLPFEPQPIDDLQPVTSWDWMQPGLLTEPWMQTMAQDLHEWEKIGKSWDWMAPCCGGCADGGACIGSQNSSVRQRSSGPGCGAHNGGKGTTAHPHYSEHAYGSILSAPSQVSGSQNQLGGHRSAGGAQDGIAREYYVYIDGKSVGPLPVDNMFGISIPGLVAGDPYTMCKYSKWKKFPPADHCEYHGGEMTMTYFAQGYLPDLCTWKLNCVCKKMGNSPGAQCVRGCLQCLRANGVNVANDEPHDFCIDEQCAGVWTEQDSNRLINAVVSCANCNGGIEKVVLRFCLQCRFLRQNWKNWLLCKSLCWE